MGDNAVLPVLWKGCRVVGLAGGLKIQVIDEPCATTPQATPSATGPSVMSGSVYGQHVHHHDTMAYATFITYLDTLASLQPPGSMINCVPVISYERQRPRKREKEEFLRWASEGRAAGGGGGRRNLLRSFLQSVVLVYVHVFVRLGARFRCEKTARSGRSLSSRFRGRMGAFDGGR